MIKKLMILCVAAMATGCMYAAPQVRLTEMVDGIEWEYFVKDNRATVRKCKTRLVVGHVNIPSILGGYTVTDIYSGAIAGCHNMTSVTIPENIISIGNSAFSDCIQLETIFIPKNVVEVGNGAFQLCDNLQSIVVDPQNSSFVSVNGLLCNADVTEIVACPAGLRSFVFPASVTSIRSHAFRGCHYLREITIPQKVSRIGTGAFGDCKNLQMITVEVGSLFYCVVNGILCDYQKKKTIACPGGYSSVIIPSSITDIGDYSFDGCWQLSNIKIPSTVIRIGESAFSGCSNLQKLKIEEGLISIGYGAFQSCELLSEVMLPSTLSKIGDSAFYNCSLRVYYQSLKPPICDGIYDSSDKMSISYIPRSWNIMDETWQDMPFEYWDPSSDGSGGTADMNAMFKVSAVVAEGCEAMGKVTGGKTAKAGTKVTLKATANKGYVFSHWEGPLGDGIDPRNPSISFVVGEKDVEFTAYFVSISDSSDITLQESYGPFVPGAEVELNLGLVGYTAKKLPSGLKLNKKTGIVKGKAKKPGEYQATFTKKGAETLTAKFIVGPMPTITIAMEGDTEKCKVTGASKPSKGYLVGKKVSLSAKGPKGTAFTGWFKDGEPWPNATDYLESKLKYVMTEVNLSLVVRFEKEKMSVACDGLSMLPVGEEVSIPIAIETQSGVKSVKGSKLPSGLKVKKDKATGEWFVTGKPKKVGTWNATIKVTAKSGAVEQLPITVTVEDKGEVVLPSADHYFKEPLKNGEGEKYVVSVGISNVEEFLPNLKLTKGSLNVSGLPAGLKYDATNGRITGVATKPGVYTVTLTVTDVKAKHVSTIIIGVEPLPDWLVGTFQGYSILEGYAGPSKEIGVYCRYKDRWTDGKIHWEVAEEYTSKVSSQGKFDLEWPTPRDIVESSGLKRISDSEFSFYCRFRCPENGPYLDYEEGEIYGKFYKNEDLSKKVGCDVGELEYYLCGIDSYNDYYDEYRVMQKNVSHINSVHKELLSVSGQGDVFVFNDVRSSNKEHSESFRGELSVKLNSKGEIVSSWQPYDKPTAIRKTKNTNLILKDFNEKTGAIKGEVGVFVEDYNVEVGDFCEYGLFFDVEIENGKLNVIWDDSRVVIHD